MGLEESEGKLSDILTSKISNACGSIYIRDWRQYGKADEARCGECGRLSLNGG